MTIIAFVFFLGNDTTAAVSHASLVSSTIDRASGLQKETALLPTNSSDKISNDQQIKAPNTKLPIVKIHKQQTEMKSSLSDETIVRRTTVHTYSNLHLT